MTPDVQKSCWGLYSQCPSRTRYLGTYRSGDSTDMLSTLLCSEGRKQSRCTWVVKCPRYSKAQDCGATFTFLLHSGLCYMITWQDRIFTIRGFVDSENVVSITLSCRQVRIWLHYYIRSLLRSSEMSLLSPGSLCCSMRVEPTYASLAQPIVPMPSHTLSRHQQHGSRVCCPPIA